MKLLKAVWAEMTITGKFKGSLHEFAIRNVDHGNKVFAGPKQVTSTFEAMALDPNKLFIDEATMTCCVGPKVAKIKDVKKLDDEALADYANELENMRDPNPDNEDSRQDSIKRVKEEMKNRGWKSKVSAFKPDPDWPKKEQFEKRYKELMAMDKGDLVKKVNSSSRLDMSHMKSEGKQDIVYHILGNEGLLRPVKKEKKAGRRSGTCDRRDAAGNVCGTEGIEGEKCPQCGAIIPTEEEAKEKDRKRWTPSSSKTAGSSVADIFFNPAKQTIDCPHCHLPMRTATLTGGFGALFCPNCRHVDYEDKVKSTVNAGSPSVDKSLQFKCLDSGNCQIV